ncbi:N-acetylmuramoyl-L-alanine amidase [Luteolibacter algae]|uniref:N-acetylmuramoyl-L-alanine amidase n=1 Tax=Luteolibacter algae TaxID=454151 RepID=A0ABW5D6D5_9BACT
MRSLLLLTLVAILPCCSPVAGPSGSSSHGGLDEWGNRPGPQGFRTVIIDAGHGGHDSGAVSRHTGQKEKDLTLDLAKRLRSELGSSFRTVMMRDNDRFVDLDDRVAFANRYPDAILVSLHFNAGPSHLSGPETYYWRVDSHGLAVRCHKAMKSLASDSRSRKMVRRRLRLTRNPGIPCLLLEGGYLSNAQEARKIASPAYRQKLAENIASAIRSQSAHGDAGTGARPAFIKAPPSRPTDAPE